MFILFLYLVKKPITCELLAAETIAKSINGKAIPIPKNRKLRKFVINETVEVEIANNTMSVAGLHGSTIRPKNEPKMNELKYGFFRTGACVLGKNLPISKLKISNIEIIPRMPKAIGEMIPMALVNDSCNSSVKIKPINSMERITPLVMIRPK